jgi:hypothetical protein
MRRLASLLALTLLASACATLSGPEPLTPEQIVAMSRAGEPPQAIIDRLRESGTVLALSASDIVRLHQAGVAPEVLDYLQQAQMLEIRRREALFSGMYPRCSWGGGFYPPFPPRLGLYSPWSMRPWGPC